MPLVWDILHASMNAEGGQLTCCCITGECGRGSQLFVPEEEFNEDFFFFFFFFEFGKLEFFEGIENFEFFFFENFGNLEFLKEFEKI